jgi:hypothetical protein
MTELPVLPCYPCPHQSICCSWGTTLSDEEAEAIGKARGAHTRYLTRWGEWRTRVRGGRCIFLGNNVCTIHGESFYPAVCRGFPWTDAETGGPYEYDQTICPEFVQRPALTSMGKPPERVSRKRGVTLPSLEPQNAGECDPGRGESKPL